MAEEKPADVRALIESLRAKGYDTQANRTLQAVRWLFNWLIERDDGTTTEWSR